MKILIIDDEEEVRFVARRSLEQKGTITVIEAEDGRQGVEVARREKPDCILLDVRMAGLDGVATLRALRAQEETAAIPVVFLTARSGASEVEALHDPFLRGVLLKPFDPMALAADVEKILRG